jgi:hypothetical protein
VNSPPPLPLIVKLFEFDAPQTPLPEFKKLNTPEQILLGIRHPEMRGPVTRYLTSTLVSPLSKSTRYHSILNTALLNGGNSALSENPPYLKIGKERNGR